jgi:hypothetical protein
MAYMGRPVFVTESFSGVDKILRAFPRPTRTRSQSPAGPYRACPTLSRGPTMSEFSSESKVFQIYGSAQRAQLAPENHPKVDPPTTARLVGFGKAPLRLHLIIGV